MSNLKDARKKYPTNSIFFTATGKIKQGLKVVILKQAEHEDRQNEIQSIKNKCLSIYREMYPPLDTFEKLKNAFKEKPDFISATKKLVERMDYLMSLEKDIINSEGGVIYCGETQTWAEKVQKIN